MDDIIVAACNSLCLLRLFLFKSMLFITFFSMKDIENLACTTLEIACYCTEWKHYLCITGHLFMQNGSLFCFKLFYPHGRGGHDSNQVQILFSSFEGSEFCLL